MYLNLRFLNIESTTREKKENQKYGGWENQWRINQSNSRNFSSWSQRPFEELFLMFKERGKTPIHKDQQTHFKGMDKKWNHTEY